MPEQGRGAMDMVNVFARFGIKPDCMENFLKIMLAYVPKVRSEEGCIRYEPCFDVADGADAEKNGHFVTISETWESDEHLKTHLASDGMNSFREAVAPLCGESTIIVLRPII